MALSLSLDKLSGVAPHHQACPRCLSVAHCFSSTSSSSTTVRASLSSSINQSIHQSSWRGIRCNMSLSLLNEGILFSERERERERERESMLFLLFSCIQSKWVCYDTANSLSLSIVTLPTKHTMCVCVTLTLSALVEGRPCLVSKCPHATLHSSTTTTNNNTKHPSSSCSMIAREFFHHTHT